MYQVITDIDNSVLEEYDTLEGALSCSSMFSHTKVMYKGIEVMAPEPPSKAFVWEVMFENGIDLDNGTDETLTDRHRAIDTRGLSPYEYNS